MISHRGVLVSLITVAMVLLASCVGCLETDKTVAARYDRDHDEFSFLVVYQQIRGGTGSSQEKYDPDTDFKYLKALYANRDHLIVTPVGSPWPFEEFGEDALLRTSATEAADVSLSTITPTLKLHRSPVRLDQVRILPGAFFLRGEGNLCYYHQVVIPGKVIDQAITAALEEFDKYGKDDALASLDGELDRRAHGGAVMSWDEFTGRAIVGTMAQIDGLFGQPPVTRPDESADAANHPLTVPVSSASLKQIRNEMTSGGITIQRRGSVLSIRVGMEEADVARAVMFFDAYRAALVGRVAQLSRAHPDRARQPAAISAAIQAMDATAVDPKTLELSIDLIRAFGAFDTPSSPPRDHPSDVLAHSRDMATLAATSDGIAIDSKLTVEQIERDFLAGTLKANPSDHAVKPGEGLGTLEKAD
jgi:hypothetical protein